MGWLKCDGNEGSTQDLGMFSQSKGIKGMRGKILGSSALIPHISMLRHECQMNRGQDLCRFEYQDLY